MQAASHPEYDVEREQLSKAISLIDRLVAKVGKHVPGASDEDTNLAEHRAYRSRYKELKAALNKPYFGRIDLTTDRFVFKPGGQRAESISTSEYFMADDDEIGPDIHTYYIGEAEFSDKIKGMQVINWHSALANLYYDAEDGADQFQTETRVYDVTLYLKRILNIEAQELLSITDEFDSRPTSHKPILGTRAEAILESLAKKRAVQMDKITGTIDREQNQLIRADADQVLLVQGVAGSGKSIIAQYRLAYLLKTSDGRIAPESCIVFGPNQIFLHYTSLVLPSLQVEDIKQTTFADWVVEQCGLASYAITDPAFEILMSSATEETKADSKHISLLKNSLRMGQLLERYVVRRQSQVTFPARGFTYINIGPHKLEVSLPFDELREIHSLTVSRGRDDPYGSPPSQNRTSGITASGSHLRSND